MVLKGDKGALYDHAIYELLKRINHSDSTGVVFVKSENSIGSIYIKNRRIVYAKFRMADEDKSLSDIFSLKDGEYNYQDNLPPIRETINYFIPEISYAYLKKDIASAKINFVSNLPDYNKKLMLSPDFAEFGSKLQFSIDEQDIINLVKKSATINLLLRTMNIDKEALLKAMYILYLSDIIDIEREMEKKGTSESNMVDRLKGFGV
ncbi:MAG: DUF4388 domain-containing protein [Nitrospirae bacterium]|nr:DUF4388 domain-containing protein [Nitrospirota bacterium]